jgi:hypothetical protein
MSRRSSRAPPKKTVTVSPSVKLGIESLVEGNEATIASMLSLGAGATALQCVAGLIDCMGVNNLNPEALLARFFDSSLLATYCKSSLGKSPNGNTAVLASRIAAQWSRPTFVPLRAAEAVDMAASEAGAAPAPAASNADGGLAATSAGLRALVQMHVSGAYPIELGGVWIRVNRLEPLNVDVLPVFTQSPHKDTVDSAAYTLYQRLVVDDSDDCSETEDRLTRLRTTGLPARPRPLQNSPVTLRRRKVLESPPTTQRRGKMVKSWEICGPAGSKELRGRVSRGRLSAAMRSPR